MPLIDAKNVQEALLRIANNAPDWCPECHEALTEIDLFIDAEIYLTIDFGHMGRERNAYLKPQPGNGFTLQCGHCEAELDFAIAGDDIETVIFSRNITPSD